MMMFFLSHESLNFYLPDSFPLPAGERESKLLCGFESLAGVKPQLDPTAWHLVQPAVKDTNSQSICNTPMEECKDQVKKCLKMTF